MGDGQEGSGSDTVKYTIAFSPAAARQFKALDPNTRTRIAAAIQKLETHPRPHGVEKLTGSDFLRIRSGDYRIIYQIQDDLLLITLLRITHRSEAYR